MFTLKDSEDIADEIFCKYTSHKIFRTVENVLSFLK